MSPLYGVVQKRFVRRLGSSLQWKVELERVDREVTAESSVVRR